MDSCRTLYSANENLIDSKRFVCHYRCFQWSLRSIFRSWKLPFQILLNAELLYINFGIFLHKVQKRYAIHTCCYSTDHSEDYLCNWMSRVSVGVKTTLNLTTILCKLSLSEPIHKLSGLFYTQNIQLPCNRSYYLVYFGVRCVSATISLGFPSCNQCLLAKMIMQCHFALL